MKLGMLRVLGKKIPALLRVICGTAGAEHGSVPDVLRAMNDRILFLGRLCLASKSPPGYVVAHPVCGCG